MMGRLVDGVVDYDQLAVLERSTLVELNKGEESTVYEDRIEEFVDDVVVDANGELADIVERAAKQLVDELVEDIHWLEDDLRVLEDELDETERFYEGKLDDAEARIAELEFEVAGSVEVVRYLEDENRALRDELEDLRFGW